MVIGWGSSPHTRGARRRLSGRRRGPVDHPRIRGEHLPDLPHLRPEPWIIPAYAGSTTRGLRRAGMRTDHPRIRGEHVFLSSSGSLSPGSSPHTRGAQGHARLPARLARIIPAYAGSTRRLSVSRALLRDHPRIRGEHHRRPAVTRIVEGSSPHTRGAHSRSDPLGGTRGIIPAYAGSTRVVTSNRSASSDHPRIRGEHSAGR